MDANGAVVSGLTRGDFRVYDNGVRRIVQDFWFDTDLPVTIGVIIDASESQAEQIEEHRQTVLELLEKVMRPGDHAFVISADEDVRLWADLAGTPGEVREQMFSGLGSLLGEPCPEGRSALGLKPVSVCGASPLWNAISDAARLKLSPLNGSKALLILTDGFDTGSTHGWHEAANALQHADAWFYAIQYRSAFRGGSPRDFYQLLAETGGARFEPPHGDDRRIVSRLNSDLRQRYVLGFRPEILSGRMRHEVNVEVTRSELSVRARKTYFQDP